MTRPPAPGQHNHAAETETRRWRILLEVMFPATVFLNGREARVVWVTDREAVQRARALGFGEREIADAVVWRRGYRPRPVEVLEVVK